MKNEILGTLNPTVGFEKQQIGRMNLTFAIDKKDSPEHEIQLLDIQISNLVQSLIENELLVLNEKRNRRFYTEFRMILHRLYEDSTQILHRFHSESTQILRKFYTDSTQSLHDSTFSSEIVYSKVRNKRTGPNKSTGEKFCQNK